MKLKLKTLEMVVGSGLIANAFLEFDKNDIIFFASGVSNSLETDIAQFQREENLVRKTIAENPDKIFVYFSTCSIYDSSKTTSPYVNHKLAMEQLVASETHHYLIARVSNAVGKGGNKNTLINFLVNSIQENKKIHTHIEASRNLIDVEDVVKIVLELIEKQKFNKIVNVAYLSNYTIVEIIALIEVFLAKKADLDLVKAGQSYSIDIPEVKNYFKRKNLQDKEFYLSQILKKYYGSTSIPPFE